ncbi:MAG: chemotaxis protein CheA [Verrucomicrobia bacterium]|nr:chemotaxis protein CheA [Verrucomicrobiota bacterium]
MESAENRATTAAKFLDLLGKIALEMAFILPDQDTGLLPLNSLLMDLEELTGKETPRGLVSALSVARGWMDLILDGTGKFTPDSISNFNQWHSWMSSALSDWAVGEEIPAQPTAWVGMNESSTAPAVATIPAASLKPTPGVPLAPVKLASVPAAPVSSVEEEAAITLNLADDAELLHEFHGESLELLQNIEIFRAFHTFKGGAGFLHLKALQDLAHELESVLDAARQSKLRITSDTIDLILAGADALKQFTQGIGLQLQGSDAGAPIVVPTSELIRRAQAGLRGEVMPPSIPVAVAINLTDGELAQSLEEMKALLSTVPIPPANSASRKTLATADAASGFVKLETWKLDALVDLVGELVIAQSMVVQDPDVQNLVSRTLERSLRQLSRTTSELQRNAMSLRMVPIRGAFQKMTRLVRDISAQQNKQVQLVMEGEETELDRNIVEKLGDPLVHMIRNSVDHGIESPDQRTACGKPSLGSIRLTASHQRGGIVIRIQDDGKGLNAQRILAKGIERGLVAPNAELTESEIFNLIFMPGFSTAEAVTDLSGRGVGMDVVRRNIEALRGKIEIQSLPGEGTTFTIILPLTLAIIDGLLVGVGNDRYIIPTMSVRESFRPRPGMVTTVHERGEVVSVRGKQTPILRLGRYLGTEGKAREPEEGILVVVESGEAIRAILVDELIGKQEVVIKSLGETFSNQNLLAGAAVLGDGRVAIILDVDTLVRLEQQPSC